MKFEQVVHMFVQPEERGVPGRCFEVLHDAGRHAVAPLRVRDLGQHHVTVVVQLAVEHRIDTVCRGLDEFPQQVDTGGVVEADETRVGLQGEGIRTERDG